MRNRQAAVAEVLGYATERRERYTDVGSLESAHYEILCPRTGSVLGRAQSLRMARRFVLMHELRDFGSAGRSGRPMRDSFAA